MKVILILSDGMRPDAIIDIPEAQKMMQNSSYALDATTVMPSVTLPCHVSLFHSVDPMRHGTTTNTYMPQVRPIPGLCEVLRAAGKKNAFFYNWEELRDLARPDSLMHSCFYSGHQEGWYEVANKKVTDAAMAYIAEEKPDFVFLYLGWSDEAGHKYGWMTEEYMRAIKESWKAIERVTNAFSEEYTVIVTADHGGHDRTHGTDMPEDMLIPVMIQGEGFGKNQTLQNVNIKDLAPTIAKLLGTEPHAEWEGKSLI